MLNDLSSPLSLMLTRRSIKPRELAAPGPDAVQMNTILQAASRVPDHGKLAPWRFVIIGADQRDAFAQLLRAALQAEKPDVQAGELDAQSLFAHQAPALVVALSCPLKDSHIPVWEQELSAGAACMNMLIAAHALGFVGAWITGWAAYSPHVTAAFGAEGTKIAGFMFLGTPQSPVEERPRPLYDSVVANWVAR